LECGNASDYSDNWAFGCANRACGPQKFVIARVSGFGVASGATRNLDSLAPSRIQALLEVEVSLRTPADSA
jgi:hypothetical protein